MFVEVELNDIIEMSESINVYNNGEVTVYGGEDAAYNQIIEGWTVMTKNAHDMPAYGVSLNKETTEAMNTGLGWNLFLISSMLITECRLKSYL